MPKKQGEVEKSQLSSFEHREWRKKPLQIELIAAYLPGTGNWLGKQQMFNEKEQPLHFFNSK